ncbi:HAMP domain-containing histidine kinase [bacterium]|nr:HAMP domain-containing histidine kinase [bacterium]
MATTKERKTPAADNRELEHQVRLAFESVADQVRHFTEVQKAAAMTLPKLYRGYMKVQQVAELATVLLNLCGYRANVVVNQGVHQGIPVDDSTHFIVPLSYFEQENQLHSLGYMAVSDFDPKRDLQGRLFLEYFGRRLSLALAHTELFANLRNARDTLLDMAGFVGHEIRSPLSTNYGLLRILDNRLRELRQRQEEGAPEGAQAVLDQCLELVQRAIVASNKLEAALDLLDIYKINPSVVRQEEDPITWGTFLREEVLGQFDIVARRAGLGLVVRIEEELAPRTIFYNRTWLSRIFDNLIGNALKYALPPSTVELWLFEQNGELMLDVRNVLETPFRSERLDDLLKKGFHSAWRSNVEGMGEGRGLGLYFVNLIVRNGFQGDLRVVSDVGWPAAPFPVEDTHLLRVGAEEAPPPPSPGDTRTAFFQVLVDFTPAHRKSTEGQ